jgi:hypothetical protein
MSPSIRRKSARASYCLVAFSLIAGPASAEESYLFDVLPNSAYRLAWEKLMKEVQPTPDWLAQFNRNYDGVSGPMKAATIDGKSYELYFVCKPQDCAAKKFEVMFEAGGKRAYGALGGVSDPPYYFGDPTPALQAALAEALKG